MHNWTVVHKTAADGTRLGEFSPNDLEFTLNHDRPGGIQYSLPKNHSLATRDKSEPYATDYELYIHSTLIQEGIITAVDAGSLKDEKVQYAGLDYLHYLDKRIWPFDPTDLGLYMFAYLQEDVFTIVETMLDTVLAQPTSLSLDYDNGLSGLLIDYKIELADTETILSKITTLSEMAPGFDFEVKPGRQFLMYTPRKPGIAKLQLEQDKNLVDFQYREQGIDGSWVLGLSRASSSRLASIKEDIIGRQKYRRLDHTAEFNGIMDEDTASQMTQGELERAIAQKMEIVATVIVEAHDFYSLVQSGWPTFLKADMGYTELDGYFKCTGIKTTVSNTGLTQAELTFDDNEIQI